MNEKVYQIINIVSAQISFNFLIFIIIAMSFFYFKINKFDNDRIANIEKSLRT